MLSAARLITAAILLSPLYFSLLKKEKNLSHSQLMRNAMIPAFMLAIHFMSWIVGVRMTLAANATLIVNLIPLAMPFVLYLMIKEKPNKREWISTGIACIGLIIIGISDFHLSIEEFYGDIICFASMITFAIYLALSRLYKQASSIWLYVIPVYAISGVICLISSFIFDDWSQVSYAQREWLIILGLGIIPTIIGHSILNAAMRWFRGQVVSVINVSQFVFAGIMAWPFFDEIPAMPFYFASLFIVAAVVALIGARKEA